LDLLKAGSSKYPLNALEDAGVDMRRPDPVKQALSMYEKYLNQMEELI
jgi:oligoendopeptidase F